MSRNSNYKVPTVIINGNETTYKNLVFAERAYRKNLYENEHDPNYKIIMVYNNFIYYANYETDEFKK